ncbi:hypothetical protein CHS0354_030820 [Potamilus streckersoni]|uniref:CCDC144C-like coiled-coil domain-containing protein n=1 Tax=Potamilus streckersoni TaxID=2493646 RepID=A0AAE0TE85_9BIVA|nr:hypothetical protein CHS0354_030820 [Potamilus streckersoni]
MKKIFSRFKSSLSKETEQNDPPKNRDLAAAEPLAYEIREKDLPKLHKAVWNGDLAKVKQLARKDPNALDKENRTPLHLAVVKGHANIVQELLEWNAKTNVGDNQAKTPLMKAVECNKEQCVQLLLEYKASVDATDKEGSSSLHSAVREGYTRIVAELIRHGAAINKKNKQGYTPLHVSVIEKRDEVTRLLLENKADPNVTDNNLRPPISYACKDGSITQVKLLLQAGADPTIKDSSGWLPEDLAESHGHHGCSQLIRDHNTKMMRNIRQTDSTSTTPRTPGSSVATPRTVSSNTMTPRAEGGDSGLFGLPSVNKEDSEEESTDVMSAHKTDENSWADDTDISQAIDEMKKTPQPKFNLAAKVKLSDSESDQENHEEQIRVVNKRIPGTGRSPGASPNPHSITPSPVFRATPSPKPSTPSKSPNQFQLSRPSLGEDNSSDDEQSLQRNPPGRVSFRDDISEHSITEEDSEEEVVKPKKPRMQEIEDEGPETAGYSPSAMSNINSSNKLSSQRIQGANGNDLMANLGLSGDEAPNEEDSDASFSDDDSEKIVIPEIPVSSKSDRNHYPAVLDDVTVHSDVTTPRQGILKNKDDHQPQTPRKHPQDSDEDEPSEWDSEAPDSRQTVSKRDESEWDSDVEDAVNPDKSGDRTGSDFDSTNEAATPRTPRNKGVFSEDEEVQELEYEDTEEVADGQDETIHEVVTFFNTPSPYDVNSPFDQMHSRSVETSASNPQQTVIETDWREEEIDQNEEGEGEVGKNEEEEEDSDASAWSSDDEEVGETHSTPAKRPGSTEEEIENEGFSPNFASPKKTSESSDEEESVSEWEIERKRQKEAEEASRKQKEDQESKEAEKQRQLQKEAERKRELERQKDLERQREVERQREAERQRQSEWEEEQRMEKVRQQEWEEEERKKQQHLKREAEEELLQERSEQSDGSNDDEDETPSGLSHGNLNRSPKLPKVPELKKPNLLVVKDFVKITTKTAPNSLTIKSGEIENEISVPVGEDQIDASQIRYVGSMPHVMHQTSAHDRMRAQKEEEAHIVIEEVVSSVHAQNAQGQEVKAQSGVRLVAGASQENENMAVNGQQRKSRQLPKPREELNRIETENGIGHYHDSLLQNGSLKASLTGPGTMSLRSDGHSEYSMDDEDSLEDPDSPRNRPETHLNGSSVNYNPFDDDGLSVTSTENGDNSLAYRPENLPYGKDMLVNMNLSDPGAVLKLQEHLREHRRQLEHERNQKMLIESKYKSLGKEKNELQKKIDNLGQQKSKLEQAKLDLEAKIRNLEYGLSEEEEKRKNAEVLLAKTKEHLKKKEEAFTIEIESKQRAELTLRNIQMDLRTANNKIKELEEEKELLQRQLNNEKNAVQLQKKINGEQQRLHEQLQQENLRTSSQKDDFENKLEMVDDDNKQAQDNAEKLRSENAALKAELQRQRTRWTDENAVLSADNEKLRMKVEDLKTEVKLEEEALTQATLQHNLQLGSTRAEASHLNDMLQKERVNRDKLEAELESIRSRLQSTTSQLEKALQARSELERKLQEAREEWARKLEKKELEVNTLKDSSQTLMSRLNATETKLTKVENELNISNSTLLERNSQLQQSVRDVQYYKSAQENLELNYRHEKEQSAKLQNKLESLQDRLSTHQHESLSLKQQLDTAQQALADRSGFDLQEKINAMMVSIKTSHEKTMDEKTLNMNETISRLREDLRNSENRRSTLEQDIWKLNQENHDMIRKLSLAEASLEMASKAKESLEQERQHLKMDMEKMQQRYQSAQDRALESQAQVASLVERLERAEQNNILSSQQLANTSATMQAFSSNKGELEEAYQKLQVESVKLEAELKHEKQKSEMLQRDLQDSQKVRSSLEALCSNLKSTNAHLEEKLGSEHAVGVTVTMSHLEKEKQEMLNQAEDEKRKTRKALDQKRIAEAKLEAEQEKASQLQKEVTNLKNYLKVAKKKLKAHGTHDTRVHTINTAFDHERNAMEEMMTAVRAQNQVESSYTEKGTVEVTRKELEAQYRLELNRKLDEVNNYLEDQARARQRLDAAREEQYSKLSYEKKRLQEEVTDMRVKYEKAKAEKDTKEMEAKRYRDLYENEMQWRMRLSEQLFKFTDKAFNYKTKFVSERQKNRLYGSMGNLTITSPVNGHSIDVSRINGSLVDDPLSNKLRAELDRSIAKHLEAAPHEMPVMHPDDNVYSPSSFAKSSADYMEILKRKFCV